MSELEDFLASGKQPPADPGAAPGASTPAPAPKPQPTPPPAPAPKPEPAKQPEPAAAQAPDPDEDIGDDGSMISPSAFHKARTDWKGKVVAAETEARLLREQLEAARKPAAAPAPPPPPPFAEPVDPARDPVGYHNRVQSVLLNDRLNMSEMLEREKHTPEAFEAAVTEFQEAAKRDPSLFGKLHAQRHPYGWLMKEIEKLRMTRDVGDDPAAYRAKLIAEERAKWEAELANGATPPVSPAAGLPPSLATTRSAAPRGTNGFSGPPSLDDVFKREAKRH